jgi:hypothetical protein
MQSVMEMNPDGSDDDDEDEDEDKKQPATAATQSPVKVE